MSQGRSRNTEPIGPLAGSPLEPTSQEIRDMEAAVDWVVAYVDSIRSMPVAPDTSSAQLRARIAEPLPIRGRDFAELLDVFRDVIVPGARHNGHPRFLWVHLLARDCDRLGGGLPRLRAKREHAGVAVGARAEPDRAD
jgi:hypothetical protein